MYFKEVMQHANDAVDTVHIFIDGVVHLAGQGLTEHAENGTLQEVHGSGWRGSFGKQIVGLREVTGGEVAFLALSMAVSYTDRSLVTMPRSAYRVQRQCVHVSF